MVQRSPRQRQVSGRGDIIGFYPSIELSQSGAGSTCLLFTNLGPAFYIKIISNLGPSPRHQSLQIFLKTYDKKGGFSVKLVQHPQAHQELHFRTRGQEGQKTLHTVTSTLMQYIEGLTKGVFLSVELVGVGFKANVSHTAVELRVGYSHPVTLAIPNDVKIFVPKATIICLFGVSKKRVSQVAATLLALKPVEPYKGKGVQLKDSTVIRKPGKKK